MGNASLAREMLLPQDPVAPLIGAVEESGERCAELIRMMLATSGYRPRGIATLRVDEMARGIASSAKTPTYGVRIDVRAEPCTFESDRGTIDTLLRGLISNAIESYGGAPGDVTVTVGIAQAPEPGGKSFEEGLARDGDYLCIAVEDRGCGMSPEIVERAFNPFFSTKFTGRGLGLPAVRGIVRAHDGLLRMQTRPGAGTRVEVWLPIESYHQSAPSRLV
jgi:signal transduction histidine kinase